jgi:hypothetical protein
MWSILLLLSASGIADAQELTLRDYAATATEDVNVGGGSEVPSPTFEQLVADADLILIGRISPPHCYLSESEREIYSDHAIQVGQFLTSRPLQKAPGVMAPIVLRHLGGEVWLEGIRVRYHNATLPGLPIGRDVVLFLKGRADNKYEIARVVFGLFEIEDGRVRVFARRRSQLQQFDGTPLTDFVERIRAARR